MQELKQFEIPILKAEINSISRNMGLNEIKGLETIYTDLSKQTEKIRTCKNACIKINEMNQKIRQLQQETSTVCEKLDNLVINSNY